MVVGYNSIIHQIGKSNDFNREFKKRVGQGASARDLVVKARELGVSVSYKSMNRYLSRGLTRKQFTTYIEKRSTLNPGYRIPKSFVVNTNRQKQINVFHYQLKHRETGVKTWKSIHVETDYNETYTNIKEKLYNDLDEVLEKSNSLEQDVVRVDYDPQGGLVNQRVL